MISAHHACEENPTALAIKHKINRSKKAKRKKPKKGKTRQIIQAKTPHGARGKLHVSEVRVADSTLSHGRGARFHGHVIRSRKLGRFRRSSSSTHMFAVPSICSVSLEYVNGQADENGPSHRKDNSHSDASFTQAIDGVNEKLRVIIINLSVVISPVVRKVDGIIASKQLSVVVRVESVLFDLESGLNLLGTANGNTGPRLH
mmetsp:Transcript_26584/g.42137  ORF Transcript_26584/g.42137 Transcript_26584/m.42137 type:complete len:202 (+) Transcript_26584:124-729(+)